MFLQTAVTILYHQSWHCRIFHNRPHESQHSSALHNNRYLNSSHLQTPHLSQYQYDNSRLSLHPSFNNLSGNFLPTHFIPLPQNITQNTSSSNTCNSALPVESLAKCHGNKTLRLYKLKV